MSKGMEKLEAFWADVVDCSEGTEELKMIRKGELVGLISDRFGVCRQTIWSYTKLLEELGWVKRSKSGGTYFLIRPEDGGDGK